MQCKSASEIVGAHFHIGRKRVARKATNYRARYRADINETEINQKRCFNDSFAESEFGKLKLNDRPGGFMGDESIGCVTIIL